MCVAPMVALAAAAVAGTGYSIYSGERAASAQRKAQEQALKQAAETKAANQRAINAANQKTPDLSAIYGANKVTGGPGSTMLTGAAGAPVTGNMLGKSTLLGGLA